MGDLGKRMFDILLSAVCLSLFAIPFLLIAVAIRVQDGGPAFFRQDRIGRDGQIFEMFKFRSMVQDAAKHGSYMTAEGDPRVTSIGRFLRRTSLDELPQLLNVFLGDMSLVGPRPDVPQQQELYTASDWKKRHSIQPGITGLAQVRDRSQATFEARLSSDLEYVDRRSLVLDLKILLKTARVATRSF
ncbi:MAG: sugar transferase [Hyphomicrobiales bacterium]